MMLRTRITLMVTLCFLALLALLWFEGRMREAEVEHRYEQAEIADHRNAWNGVINPQLRRLEAELKTLPNVERLLHVMSGDDGEPSMKADDGGGGGGPPPDDLEGLFAGLVQHARSRTPDVDMEVALADGKLLFASQTGGARMLYGERLKRVLNATEPAGGLDLFPSGEIGLAVGTPVITRAGASGAVGLTVSVAPLLPAMQATASAGVFLVSRDGNVLAASAQQQWEQLGLRVGKVPPGGSFLRFTHRGSTYEAVEIPLRGLDAAPIATLVTIADVTVAWGRSQLILALSSGGVLAAAALFLGGLNWYLRTSFRPLNTMIRVLNALSRGDASVVGLQRSGDDEIGRLGRTVESFRRSQKLLAETTAAKERTDSELAVARDIQSRMVPHEFAFPTHPEFALHAVMEPAKAVGGDLYDFFLIDERHLFFLVGDVSDKGVPAALYMAIAKALFKNVAQSSDLPLHEVMGRVNRQLTEDNPSEMFVTVFACVLDLETGVIVYSDGGHELPIRLRADGAVQLLPKLGGLALGFLPDYSYRTGEIALDAGDALVLYTDGVTEAMNLAQEMFRSERITDALAGCAPGAPSVAIARALLTSVRGFVGAAPQSDDITILVVRWNGPASTFAAEVCDELAVPQAVT